MKPTLIFLLMLFSLSGFSQAVGVNKTLPHDSIQTIRQYYDTIKVKIYYEDGENLKVYPKGFEVRFIEANSNEPKAKLLSYTLYDDRMKKFKPVVFNVIQR